MFVLSPAGTAKVHIVFRIVVSSIAALQYSKCWAETRMNLELHAGLEDATQLNRENVCFWTKPTNLRLGNLSAFDPMYGPAAFRSREFAGYRKSLICIRPVCSALITAVDAPLAPFWVWLFLAETPGNATLLGGAFVTAAVIGHVRWANR